MSEHYDLLIRGGTVIDGSGSAGVAADVAVDGDRIARVGDLTEATAGREVDAAGLIVSPGFIDTHCHDDLALLDDPDMTFKVSQGVTTVITGNCGISLAPTAFTDPGAEPIRLLGSADRFFTTVSEYRSALSSEGHGANAALLAGHGSLRAAAMGSDTSRVATADEQRQMRDALGRALVEGALGLSSGIQYPIAYGADTDEVRSLADVLDGGIIASHIRDEGNDIISALDEAFEIAGDNQLIVSHLKCAGVANHGRAGEVLARIDVAAEHQRIRQDTYPYLAGSTVLSIDHIDRATEVLIAESPRHPEASGRPLTEVAAQWDCSIAETVERLRPATAIYFQMHEDDLHAILRHPNTMIGSDGIPSGAHPHPRLWGTFPRVLGPVVRSGVLSLPEAVHKMTGLPAETFGLRDRGEVAAGRFADLVVFDPETIEDTATYEDPISPAAGIHHVFVNGVENGRAGRFLTR